MSDDRRYYEVPWEMSGCVEVLAECEADARDRAMEALECIDIPAESAEVFGIHVGSASEILE